MKRYTIHISPQAEEDMQAYIDHIMQRYKMPVTASRHKEELYARIFSLSSFAESVRISDRKDILCFGANARSIRYKKMLIVYTVHHTLVVVRAVMPAVLVK